MAPKAKKAKEAAEKFSIVLDFDQLYLLPIHKLILAARFPAAAQILATAAAAGDTQMIPVEITASLATGTVKEMGDFLAQLPNNLRHAADEIDGQLAQSQHTVDWLRRQPFADQPLARAMTKERECWEVAMLGLKPEAMQTGENHAETRLSPEVEITNAAKTNLSAIANYLRAKSGEVSHETTMKSEKSSEQASASGGEIEELPSSQDANDSPDVDHAHVLFQGNEGTPVVQTDKTGSPGAAPAEAAATSQAEMLPDRVIINQLEMMPLPAPKADTGAQVAAELASVTPTYFVAAIISPTNAPQPVGSEREQTGSADVIQPPPGRVRELSSQAGARSLREMRGRELGLKRDISSRIASLPPRDRPASLMAEAILFEDGGGSRRSPKRLCADQYRYRPADGGAEAEVPPERRARRPMGFYALHFEDNSMPARRCPPRRAAARASMRYDL